MSVDLGGRRIIKKNKGGSHPAVNGARVYDTPERRVRRTNLGRAAINALSRCFFFSSRRRHTRLSCDWSSDVCSSDLSYAVSLDRKSTRLESSHKILSYAVSLDV